MAPGMGLLLFTISSSTCDHRRISTDSRGKDDELSRTRTGPGKRIIKGRPIGVGFDRSHHYLQQGAPS